MIITDVPTAVTVTETGTETDTGTENGIETGIETGVGTETESGTEIKSMVTNEKESQVTVKQLGATLNPGADSREVVKTTMTLANGVNGQYPKALADGTSVAAGGTITVNATLEVNSYPYYNTLYVKNPVFYIRLPENELELVQESVKVNRENVHLIVQNALTTEPGYKLYPITFKEDGENGGAPLGYFNEGLGAIKEGNYLTLTFKLQTSKKLLVSKPYDLKDIVCAGAGGIETEATSGQVAHAWNHALKEADNYSAGTARVSYSSSAPDRIFTVTAGTPMVPFEAALKEEGKTDFAYEPSIDLMDKTGELKYKISFNNSLGGTIDGSKFYYLIPVLKRNEPLHEHMYSKNEEGTLGEPPFTLELTGPLQLTGSAAELLDVKYCYNDIPDGYTNIDFKYYSNGKADFSRGEGGTQYAEFLSADKVTADKRWADVGAVKIVCKDQEKGIPDGKKCSMELPLKYDMTDITPGLSYSWASCGVELYTKGSASSEAHETTNIVTVRVHPKEQKADLVLTAVKDDYIKRDEVRMAELKIPAYQIAASENKKLKVKSVAVKNGNEVELVNQSEIELHRDAPGYEKKFSLSAQLDPPAENSSSEQSHDLLVSSTSGLELGTINTQECSVIKFALDNVNALETLTPAGEVEVVLGIGDDITITADITINTVGTQMKQDSDIKTKSIMGKQYKDFMDQTNLPEDILITAESAISIQYDIQNYVSGNYGMPFIRGNFPEGISVILAEVTDREKPEYFYYYSTADETEISLDSFREMGTGEPVNLAEKESLKHKLIFILDYSQSFVEAGSNIEQSLTLVFPAEPGKVNGTDGGADAAADCEKTVKWQLSPRRSIGLTAAVSSPLEEEKVTISGDVTVAMLEGNDTYHNKSSLTLAFRLYKKEGASEVPYPYPAATKVKAEVNGKTTDYGTQSNLCRVSLGDIQVGPRAYKVTFDNTDWTLPEGTYILKPQLYLSQTENYIPHDEAVAEQEIAITVAAPDPYGMKVKNSNAASHLAKPGENKNLEFTYEAGSSTPEFSAELYQKDSSGIYRQISSEGLALKADQIKKTVTLTVPIAGTAEEYDTYRILLKMEADKKVIEVPHNLVVYTEPGDTKEQQNSKGDKTVRAIKQ